MNPSDTSPPHRPPRAPLVRWSVAAIAVLVLAVFLTRPLFDRSSPSVLPVLAVMNFENMTDRAAAKLTGEVIASLVVTDLSTAEKIRVLPRQRIFDALEQLGADAQDRIDPSTIAAMAELTNARWVLTGVVLAQWPQVEIGTELFDAKNRELVATHRITGAPGETVFIVADRVVGEVRADLQLSPRAGRGAVSDRTTRSEDAYRAYVMGEESRFRLDRDGAREQFARAVAHDSTFAMAHMRLSTYLGGPEKRAALQRAARYAASTTEREQHFISSGVARESGDRGTAIAQLEWIVAHDPDDKEVYFLLGELHEAHDPATAIQYWNRAIAIDPDYTAALDAIAGRAAVPTQVEQKRSP